jgi:hypothetical protein
MKILKDWQETHYYIEFKIIPGRDNIEDESDLFEKFQLKHMYGNCVDDNKYEVWYEPDTYSREIVINISRELAKENGIDFEYISNGFVYTRESKAFIGTKKEFKKKKP